jgi:hypothetical protein
MGESKGRDQGEETKPLLPVTSAKIKERKSTSLKKEHEKRAKAPTQKCKIKGPKMNAKAQARSLKKARAQLRFLHLTKVSEGHDI